MPALDIKQYLLSSLQMQHGRLVKDLNAIPAELHGQAPGGCVRTPINIITECAWVNGWISELLEGGPAKRLTDEEEAELYASIDTTAKALTMLDNSVNRLTAAYEALDPDTLGDITDRPFGRPVPKFQPAFLPVSHMMYHDGQLNLIQSLNGDDKIHW